LRPLRTDLMTCGGAMGEFFVNLSLVEPDGIEERFGRLPNEIRIEADSVTATRAVVTAIRGVAGAAAPTPTPLPRPVSMTLSTYCVFSAGATRSIFGSVQLDHPVRTRALRALLRRRPLVRCARWKFESLLRSARWSSLKCFSPKISVAPSASQL